MTGWRRDDPFQLELEHHPHHPWPVRDSTGGVATQSAPPEPSPDIWSELKLLSVAAVVGMSLAVGTVLVLRANEGGSAISAASPVRGATPAAAKADSVPVQAAPPSAASDTRRGHAKPAPAPADAEPNEPMPLPVQSTLAAIAGAAGAEADRAASEAAPAIADERAKARAAAAEARERARAAAKAEAETESATDTDEVEDAENVHAAAGDDIIDLDEPDDESEAESAEDPDVSWSEIQARYDRLRGKSSPKKKSKRKKRREAEKAEKRDEPAPAASESAEPSGPAGAFDRDAATSAMFAAAGGASGCATEGGPSGRGRVSVTLSPSGHVSSVDVGGPFAGTKTGSCIASLFRSISLPPFTGGPVALQKSFHVRAAKATASTGDDDEPVETKRSKKPKKKKAKRKKRRRGRRRGRARR
ncbi:MAG TPA: hypothetical protein ENK57_22890 [Polyangiaceae bacterium]|nr:hypothetical protein [Polyangiaceae bacterium]